MGAKNVCVVTDKKASVDIQMLQPHCQSVGEKQEINAEFDTDTIFL